MDICAYCGEETDQLTNNHIFPKAFGGISNKKNIVQACKSCNQLKSDLILPSLIKKHFNLSTVMAWSNQAYYRTWKKAYVLWEMEKKCPNIMTEQDFKRLKAVNRKCGEIRHAMNILKTF